jgi:hypothetical protein
MATPYPYPGPVALFNNLPIEIQFYQPSQFTISNVTLGTTTIVTTSVNNNYVVGQLVRLLIPPGYGCTQLNELSGYVISLPGANQVEVSINSSKNVNAFISSPFVATITNITKASKAVLTVNNPVSGGSVLIQNVGGMTQLNGNVYVVFAQNTTTITLLVDSTSFTTYTSGGTATVFPINGAIPQILAIGDVNSGQTNASGPSAVTTFIPGSFINIS